MTMENLTIEKDVARRLYKEGPEWFRPILEGSIPKKDLVPNVMDRIKSLQDAFADQKIDTEEFYARHKNDSPDELAHKEIKVFAAALNEGVKFDFTNTKQKKWFPVFAAASGFRFDGSYCRCTYAAARCGSRLCYANKELSDYAATTIIDTYKKFIL